MLTVCIYRCREGPALQFHCHSSFAFSLLPMKIICAIVDDLQDRENYREAEKSPLILPPRENSHFAMFSSCLFSASFVLCVRYSADAYLHSDLETPSNI